MKNLFDPALALEIKNRIMQLRPESERQWGRLVPANALAHCTRGLQMATGEINPQRASFLGNVIGRLIKPLVLNDDKPMRRNSPSAPELFLADLDPCDFEHERAQLIAAVDDFASRGAACCSRYPHPFFGPLTPEQWAILQYKHLDHHLNQFGV